MECLYQSLLKARVGEYMIYDGFMMAQIRHLRVEGI